MKCPTCGRFMRATETFSNDHYDSAETNYHCTNGAHP